MHAPDPPRKAGLLVVVRVDGAIIAAPRAPARNTSRARRLRWLADWLWAVAAKDGIGDRFAIERQREQELIRRVERTRLRQ